MGFSRSPIGDYLLFNLCLLAIKPPHYKGNLWNNEIGGKDGNLMKTIPQYRSSRWIDSSGKEISKCLVYEDVYVEVIVENPLRKQTVIGLVKVTIYRNNRILPDVNVKQSKHVVTLPPLSSERIIVPFKPLQESMYYYEVSIDGTTVYKQPNTFPPRLCALRRDSQLILNEPINSDETGNSTFTVTGKLIDALSGEGIGGAKIGVYDMRMLRKDELLAYGITSNDGTFTIKGLKVFKIGGGVRIYAKFNGDDLYKPSISSQYTLDTTGFHNKYPLEATLLVGKIKTMIQRILKLG
ncbi:MAG: hypothetical protein QXH97_03265 [Candidatus Bathyarchaeia archaeon]